MYKVKEFFHHWNNVHNVTLRLIRQIPADRLDFKPSEKSQTLAEVATHIFHGEKVFAETGAKGIITLKDFNENPAPEMKSVEQIYEYGKKIHGQTNEMFRNKSPEELEKTVATPWGKMSLFRHLQGAYDHHWHQRGKLYVYLEMLDVEDPVFVYDYPGERAPV